MFTCGYQLSPSAVKLNGKVKTRYLKKLKLLNGVDPCSFTYSTASGISTLLCLQLIKLILSLRRPIETQTNLLQGGLRVVGHSNQYLETLDLYNNMSPNINMGRMDEICEEIWSRNNAFGCYALGKSKIKI